MNLIGNAIKFTPRGEIFLEVRRENGDTPGLFRFTVTDTGIGIPARKHKEIFEAFQQVDSSMTRRFGGTGLGLAITTQLVGLMGGRIWVESEETKGSSFHCTIAFTLAPDAPSLPPAMPQPLQGVPVLVLGSRQRSREALMELLTSWGLNPVQANHPRAALTALAQASSQGRPIPLVLLDGLDAEEDVFIFARKVQADPRLGVDQVIGLCSVNQVAASAAQGEGFIHTWLTRPAKHSVLQDALLVAVEKKDQKAKASVPDAKGQPRRRRILLAEDGLVNQKVATALLTRRGHSVVIANNGLEALSRLQEQSFDLVLMDVQMPEMDGLEATKAIRGLEQQTGGHLPIFAMTAHAMKGDQERCLAAGMDGYLSKPIESDKLYALVEGFSRPSRPTVVISPQGEPLDFNLTS